MRVLLLTVIDSGQRGAGDLLAGLAGSGTTADEQELIGSAVMLFAAGVDSPASMVGLGTCNSWRGPRSNRLNWKADRCRPAAWCSA